MKKFIFILILFTLFSSSVHPAEKKKPAPVQPNLNRELFGQPFLQYATLLSDKQLKSPVRGMAGTRKSIPKGVLLSLAVPGMGEIYSKSKIKGYIFAGIEAAAWISYILHNKKGEDWKQESLGFADKNWDYNRWQNWWNSLSAQDQERFPRYDLPEKGSGQYYEVIGKYGKFNAGWKDVNWISGLWETEESAASNYYANLRSNSNSEKKLAATSTIIVFTNHILSALDAAWTVNQYNKNFKTRAKVNYVFINRQPAILACLSVDW